MRGRIRTIKPEALLDEELWDLEAETGLPIYRAFTGLWMYADREGRFEWRPRALKAAILPYWDGDFSRVLDALTTRGFVQKYAVSGADFGVVVTFKRHQVINNREEQSQIPPPPESLAPSSTSTREPRVNDASPTSLVHALVEGKGREGKGSAPPLPRESGERVDGQEAAAEWHAAMNAVGYTLLHAEHAWRAEYETVAAACNATDAPYVALHALCRWFWTAAEGPVVSKRVRPHFTNPGALAKYVSSDLESAHAWWVERHPQPAQEAAQ